MAVEWLESFNEAISLIRGAVGLVKDVRDTLPEDTRRTIDEALEQADRATRLAEAQIAKGLGYRLCQCQFPPKVMLYSGWDERATFLSEGEIFKCPDCGREDPPMPLRRRNLLV